MNESTSYAEEAAQSVLRLAAIQPELARTIGKLTSVIADEAARNKRFAGALQALLEPSTQSSPHPEHVARRAGRRQPGVLDPFAVLAEFGQDGLRSRLEHLDLEELKDIVAEHGMDHDRLAMRWRDPQRVIDRILSKVDSRNAKGSAFRGDSPPAPPIRP